MTRTQALCMAKINKARKNARSAFEQVANDCVVFDGYMIHPRPEGSVVFWPASELYMKKDTK